MSHHASPIGKRVWAFATISVYFLGTRQRIAFGHVSNSSVDPLSTERRAQPDGTMVLSISTWWIAKCGEWK